MKDDGGHIQPDSVDGFLSWPPLLRSTSAAYEWLSEIVLSYSLLELLHLSCTKLARVHDCFGKVKVRGSSHLASSL